MATIPSRFLLHVKDPDVAAQPSLNAEVKGGTGFVLMTIFVVVISSICITASVRFIIVHFCNRPPRNPIKPPPRGLKKCVIRKLPKRTFTHDVNLEFSDCPICLTEFSEGEEIRILPQCEHGYHVGCIDTWLRCHSSCPSCRKVLVVPTSSCHKRCGIPIPSIFSSCPYISSMVVDVENPAGN